jgi:aquaporin Z
MKKLLVEFMGTFFLTLIAAITGQPLAIGLILVGLIYIGGHISGANYNPAVTLAIWVRKQACPLTGRPGANDETGGCCFGILSYMIFQCLGAFSAAALFKVISSKYFVPAPAMGLVIWKAILVEALLTFVLCMVILVTATSKKAGAGHVTGLAVGLTLTALLFAGGPISGGVFNPAIGFGTIIFDVINKGVTLPRLIIYTTGPFLGGLFAGIFYKLTNDD